MCNPSIKFLMSTWLSNNLVVDACSFADIYIPSLSADSTFLMAIDDSPVDNENRVAIVCLIMEVMGVGEDDWQGALVEL